MRVRLATAAAKRAALVTCAVVTARPSQAVSKDANQPRSRLPRWAVTCIAGAVGECGGQFFLYPVETIKVLCQRNGTGAVPTLRKLVQEHTVPGAAARLMRGITGTMVVSALLGAAYLAIFRATTSIFSGAASHKVEAPPPPLHPPTLPAAVVVADREHADTVFNDMHEDRPARSNERGVVAGSANFGGVVASAMATSVAIALLTGPIEMARNRLQAGVVSGSLLAYTMSRRGLREVLPFLGPFCLTAVPHDFAELVTVYVGGNAVDAVRRGAPWLRVRREVLDACVGGLAGAFGVFLSAPADCIKTKTLTMSARSAFVRAHANPQALLAAGTGTQWRAAALFTLRAQGIGGLFVGVWPRLVDEVPGSMLHWTLVEACYRWLGASEELA